MPQDPALAFAQNLIQNYMQFKMMQFQVEREARKEERYERQLADINLRFAEKEKRILSDPRREFAAEKLAFAQDPSRTPGEKAAMFGGGVTVNISAGEREKTAESLATMDSLYNLKNMYDSAKTRTGPLVGRLDPIIGQLGLTTQEQENFMAATSAFKNKIIREITGAQMSEAEADRIMKQVPDVIDHPTRWEAKWEQSLQNLQYLQRRRGEIQSGMATTPWTSPPDKTPGQTSLFRSQDRTARTTYPYNAPNSKEAFLNMVRELNESGDVDAARGYYEQWLDNFDWEEE